MKELQQKLRSLMEETEVVKKQLCEEMKKAGINKLDFDDGSYLRLWNRRVEEGVSWFGRNKDLEKPLE